jgi:hypothetical protein
LAGRPEVGPVGKWFPDVISKHPGAVGRRIGGVELRRVAAGKRKTVRLKAQIPPDFAPGDYVLVASLDEEKANYDLRRDNNLLVKKKRIEIR